MRKILIYDWQFQRHPEWFLNHFKKCNISIIMVENKEHCECWGLPMHIETLMKSFDIEKITYAILE